MATSTTAETDKGSCSDSCGAKLLPRIASGAPVRLHVLEPNEDGSVPECDCGRKHVVYGQKYQYCTCGLSKAQPWCDEACVAAKSPFKPTEFVVDKKQTYLLMCACKRTEDARGFCDGQHIHIDWTKVDW